jgi:hypothetical protein
MEKISKEELFKEIDLIQACINRMSHNSFLIKGWALTLFAGVTALLGKQLLTAPWLILCVILLPFVGFWYIDAFFLTTEKRYRKLYQWVLENRAKDITDFQYSLDPSRFEGCYSVWSVMRSNTLTIFYGIPSLILIVLSAILLCQA